MYTQADPDLAQRTATVPTSRTAGPQPDGPDLGPDLALDADLDADLDPDLGPDLDADLDPDLGPDLELPFGWEPDPAGPAPDDRDAVFRFPSADDPEPRAGRVLGMAAWATGLGVLGLGAAARGGLAMLTTSVPDWYATAGVTGGLLGITLTVGAFLSVHRSRTPWVLLGLATVPLVATLTINAMLL